MLTLNLQENKNIFAKAAGVMKIINTFRQEGSVIMYLSATMMQQSLKELSALQQLHAFHWRYCLNVILFFSPVLLSSYTGIRGHSRKSFNERIHLLFISCCPNKLLNKKRLMSPLYRKICQCTLCTPELCSDPYCKDHLCCSSCPSYCSSNHSGTQNLGTCKSPLYCSSYLGRCFYRNKNKAADSLVHLYQICISRLHFFLNNCSSLISNVWHM